MSCLISVHTAVVQGVPRWAAPSRGSLRLKLENFSPVLCFDEIGEEYETYLNVVFCDSSNQCACPLSVWLKLAIFHLIILVPSDRHFPFPINPPTSNPTICGHVIAQFRQASRGTDSHTIAIKACFKHPSISHVAHSIHPLHSYSNQSCHGHSRCRR